MKDLIILKPLISIIMPVYNATDYLKNSINSVFVQTYSNWQLIIVDDASTDNSAEIIRYYAERDSRITPVFLNKNSGPSHARNLALNLASGKYVAFLDSDDCLKPCSLEQRVKAFNDLPVDMVVSGCEIVSQKGKALRRLAAPLDKLGTHSAPCSPLQLRVPLYLHTHLISYNLLKNTYFDEKLCISEDRKFLAELYAKAKAVTIIDDYTYQYIMRKKSLTHNMSCSSMLASVEVERDLFEQDKALGYISPGYEEYVNRMLAAIRFIYKTRSHIEKLSVLQYQIEKLDRYSYLLHGWRRAKYYVYKFFPSVYKYLSIIMTMNVKNEDMCH
jgi:glycosyltransferase involved in cell wall biosynthesis